MSISRNNGKELQYKQKIYKIKEENSHHKFTTLPTTNRKGENKDIQKVLK